MNKWMNECIVVLLTKGELESSGRGTLEVPLDHLPGRTEKDMKNFNQASRYPDQDSNRAPPEYESTMLPLRHLA
jgi:hypothetical protein